MAKAIECIFKDETRNQGWLSNEVKSGGRLNSEKGNDHWIGGLREAVCVCVLLLAMRMYRTEVECFK